MTGVYATAREFLERALSRAEALGNRKAARLIAVRLCEVIEQEDFNECGRLDEKARQALPDGEEDSYTPDTGGGAAGSARVLHPLGDR